MSNDPRTVFRGRRFNVVEVVETSSDGKPHTRQFMEHPGAVVIIPFVDDDHICLIRNLRVAVGETLIELPAGTRETGELPEQTAKRELLEETGYRTERVEQVNSFFPSPGVMNEEMILFAAFDLVAGEHQREASEQIENLVVRVDEALQMIERGDIRDGKTLVGLLLWARFHAHRP